MWLTSRHLKGGTAEIRFVMGSGRGARVVTVVCITAKEKMLRWAQGVGVGVCAVLAPPLSPAPALEFSMYSLIALSLSARLCSSSCSVLWFWPIHVLLSNSNYLSHYQLSV